MVVSFVRVPTERLAPDTLEALLEEFASRDGTDYGERETPLNVRVAQLRTQMEHGDIALLYDLDSESWDLLPDDTARDLLGEADGGDRLLDS